MNKKFPKFSILEESRPLPNPAYLWPCDWPSADARHQQRQHQFQFINYNLGHQRGIPTDVIISDPMKSKASKVT